MGTKLVVADRGGPGWLCTVYPTAGEAVLSFRSSVPPASGEGGRGDQDANRLRAERRARTTVRRYCAANSIDRLVTLTYGPPFCVDHRELRADLARFVRRLRCELGERFPYVWVPELHKDGERLHAHFGLNRYIRKPVLAERWRHGFVDVRQLRGSAPRSPEPESPSRRAARYLSKYVGKAFDAGEAIGCHRYEVGQGFQPASERVLLRTEAEARQWAVELMGGDTPSYVWSCDEVDDWAGPPTRVAFWDR